MTKCKVCGRYDKPVTKEDQLQREHSSKLIVYIFIKALKDRLERNENIKLSMNRMFSK